MLTSLLVRGEISNYKCYPSGHHYFSLKDEQSSLRCVMFRGDAVRLRFRPANGMRAVAFGRVSVFPRDGQYQLYCTELLQDGRGALDAAFERLRRRLEEEGLFDPGHKTPLPGYPKKIALVTSPAGAAVRDMLGRDLAGLLSQPNNNLGVEYIRALNALGSGLRSVTIPRTGAGHDGGEHPEYPSASFVREQIRSGALGSENPAWMKNGERWVLGALRAMDGEDFAALPDCGEGLSHRIYQAVRQGRTLTEVYGLAKTKRYAHARIRRAVLWGVLGLKELDRPDAPLYLRVLGANAKGREVLRAMKGRAALPVITKPAHGKGIPLMELEARCTDFYQLCRGEPGPCGTEWMTNPIMLSTST